MPGKQLRAELELADQLRYLRYSALPNKFTGTLILLKPKFSLVRSFLTDTLID